MPIMSDRHRTPLPLAFAIALGLFVAYQVRHILRLIYVSALFAVVIGPVIELIGRVPIGRWRPGRGFALFIMIAIAFGPCSCLLSTPTGHRKRTRQLGRRILWLTRSRR